MALVSKAIPGLYNGVNQQPAPIRLDTQCEAQENCFASLVDGLIKRQSTAHVANLSTNASANAYVHVLNRDSTEQYVVVFTGNATEPIEVFTIKGVKCTVRYGTLSDALVFTPDATAKIYATVADPANNIRCLTIADYTFVVNRTVVTAIGAATVPGTIKSTVQTFAKLPIDGVATGDIHEIRGDQSSKFTSFYVQHDGAVWKEVARPGVYSSFSPYSLPHRLVRTGVNEFTFAPVVWKPRQVGDDYSNPIPSFVGDKINHVFFFKGRLGFISSSRVFMSRTSDYFNLWRSTILDVLDDDPIDVDAQSSMPNAVVNLLDYAPFNSQLFLISNNQQFMLSSSNSLLTTKTVSITPVTSFPFNEKSNLAVAGTNVLFSHAAGNFQTLREYYVQPDTLINDAADITSHIPNYIPAGTTKLAVCNNMDVLFLHSSTDGPTLYVYKYYWAGTEKPQSCWSKWTFGGNILGMGVIDTVLYLVIQRSHGVCLEALDLRKMDTGTLPFRVHLDRLCKVHGVYDAAQDKTIFTLPYSESSKLVCVCAKSGLEKTSVTEQVSANTYKVSGNFTTDGFYFGVPYQMLYEFSEFFIRDSQTKTPDLTSSIQMRSLTLSFNETGYFQVKVKAPHRAESVTPWSGFRVGQATFGQASILSGTQRFMVLGKNQGLKVSILNNSYLPCSFQSAAFEVDYSWRSKPI